MIQMETVSMWKGLFLNELNKKIKKFETTEAIFSHMFRIQPSPLITTLHVIDYVRLKMGKCYIANKNKAAA